MKVLILVLSARRDPWDKLMDVSLETWDAEEHPQTKTVYYCGKGGTAPGRTLNPAWVSADTKSDVFYSPSLTESLEDVSPRTIEAFEWSLELEWDFLARPNSSCYVHKRNLVAFCETLPKENVICGILTGGDRSFLWGGCQFIFSRDVIEKMVANKAKWDMKAMDDVSITFMAEDLKIPLESNGRCGSINMMPDGSNVFMAYGHGENFTFTDFADMRKAEGHFFIRVKQDLRRHEDVRIMRELKKHLP